MSLQEVEPRALETLEEGIQCDEGSTEETVVIRHEHNPPTTRESTLLPAPIANAVSLVTRSSSLYIRLGTFIGGLAIDGARVTTLTGLELSRAVIEGIIHRAGKDVANRSTGELGKLEAESLLERSIANLHATITGISFAASTGFHFSYVALSSATDVSQQLLGALDSILGSTDSSRAIASIITLIRREFQNPATGVEGEKVTTGDLLLGICGLALLQRWCRRLTDLECREKNYEEVLWDVVVLDDGRRADVVAMFKGTGQEDHAKLSFMNTRDDELLETIEREEPVSDQGDDKEAESILRQRLIQSLPSDASVSITTSTITTTTKTITVEVSGFEPPVFLPPPGVEVLEEHAIHVDNLQLSTRNDEPEIRLGPRYRVVYGIVGNRLRSTSVTEEDLKHNVDGYVSHDNDSDNDYGALGSPTSIRTSDVTPLDEPLPKQEEANPIMVSQKGSSGKSKIPRLSFPSTSEEKLQGSVGISQSGPDNLANQKRSRMPISPISSDHSPKQPFLKPISNDRISKKSKAEEPVTEGRATEKQQQKPSFRQALKQRSSNKLSNIFKDASREEGKPKVPPRPRPTWSNPTHASMNITRFVKFASASYGSNFLRVMGISVPSKRQELDAMHHLEHQSFSSHTQLDANTILLSSFVDSQGGTDSSGLKNTGVPMVHYVSLDHQSHAVVLTCRGTLGFEDVLADMTCDYDELVWRGKAYKVHKGIHVSARRLLEGSGGRVMTTIKAALEEFPDYGLVICGHSLGGGVSALLAIMISEPTSHGTSFVTSYAPGNSFTPCNTTADSSHTLYLPPGRPIHVYAYGPPATVSPSLRLATRGLITTIVNGNDLVPLLSLGLLHDLQAVALAFKNDNSGAKAEVKRRVWTGMSNSFSEKWYGRSGHGTDEEEEDKWAYAALKALRVCMLSSKLVPPGEVFVVESMAVLKRNSLPKKSDKSDSRNDKGESGLGKPATRTVLKYVRDVEKRYGEVRFGGSMLLDHSPGRYEASLRALGKGVLGDH
ncbi:hypothetical protein EYC84_000685 [Monilinia fructicola]|uniref:sn-1-specific diacylglycerol lipase n=1 Tax=Monilinia fructicola TaxID=38448 RepID=A0A5M9JMI5_MONFR|nr:hypothetical protein EYC84_000685 [Monilinia fructicola]